VKFEVEASNMKPGGYFITAKGKAGVTAGHYTEEELTEASNSFNDMMDDINKLREVVKEKEAQKVINAIANTMGTVYRSREAYAKRLYEAGWRKVE
jgi:hypothetical protein